VTAGYAGRQGRMVGGPFRGLAVLTPLLHASNLTFPFRRCGSPASFDRSVRRTGWAGRGRGCGSEVGTMGTLVELPASRHGAGEDERRRCAG
jgi:hypothetical protein